MGVKAAFASFEVGCALRLDLSICPRANRAQAAELHPLLAPPQVHRVIPFDPKDFAVLQRYELGARSAILRIDVPFPQVRWFEDVSVRIDDSIVHTVSLPDGDASVSVTPPAFETSAATSLQWLKAKIGASMLNICVI